MARAQDVVGRAVTRLGAVTRGVRVPGFLGHRWLLEVAVRLGASGGSESLVRVLVGTLFTLMTRGARSLGARATAREAVPARLCAWVCLTTGGLFVALTVAVLANDLRPADAAVRAVIVEWVPGPHGPLATWANAGGSWRGLVPAAALLLIGSTEARRRWWLWSGAVIAAPLLAEACKALVGHPRPSGTGLGFPSGHAAAAAAFAGMIVYWAGRVEVSPAWRRALRAAALTAMLLVGLARIVLGAHWPGDVLGGFALGGFCAAVAAWIDSAGAIRADRRVSVFAAQPRRAA